VHCGDAEKAKNAWVENPCYISSADCLALINNSFSRNHGLITKPKAYDKDGAAHTLTFIYGKASTTWGWVCRDWLD
jgi:hypothetical protein